MQADQMIVVRNVDIVFGVPICELAFHCNSSLNQEL
jgi:hypothetical protein